MLTFDYCENVGSNPKTIESFGMLLSLFSRPDVKRNILALRGGNADAKKKLPAICWQATYGGKRRKNENASPSGYFMLDVDHVEDPAEIVQSRMGTIKNSAVCFVHISPSGKGLRFVARCSGLLTIAEEQKALAEQLHLPYDAVCKDMARLAFVSMQCDILYYEREAFEKGENLKMPTDKLTRIVHAEAAAPQSLFVAHSDKEYRGVLLSDFVRRWFDVHGGLPQEGERNTRFYQLGRDLRYICDFQPARMLEVISSELRCGLSDAEILATFQSACVSSRRASLPREVEALLADLQGDIDGTDGVSKENFEKMLPPLPSLFQPFVDSAPKDFKPAVILSLLPIFGTICTNIRARYLDGELHAPNFITVIEAPQASGKSFTRRLVDITLKKLREDDAISRAEEQAYLKQLKLSKNTKEQPVDPRAVVRIIPASISIAKLLQRLDNANGKHLFSFCEEIDTLSKSNKAGAWSQKSDIYRNAFDNAEYGQDYMSENSYSAIVHVFYNMLLCGTPRAVSRFFNDPEDGLVSRVIFCALPSQFAASFPRFNPLSESKIRKIQNEIEKLMSNNTICEYKLPALEKRIRSWLEAKRQETLKTMNIAEDTFRRRAAVTGFRAGMIFAAIDGCKDRVSWSRCSKFAIWVANYVLAQLIDRYGDALNEETTERVRRISCNDVYSSLPSTFERSELESKLVVGRYKIRARQVLYLWKREGLIEKINNTQYQKKTNKEE